MPYAPKWEQQEKERDWCVRTIQLFELLDFNLKIKIFFSKIIY
jgi:hypothetical protein